MGEKRSKSTKAKTTKTKSTAKAAAPKSAKAKSPATSGATAQHAHLDPHDHLTRVDEKLARVIERVGRSPIADRAKESFDANQAFKALVHVIVSQQLSGKAADTIFGRVEALGGGALPGPAELLAIPDEKLRAAGLSGAKTRGVKDLAARVLDGSLQLASLHAHDDDAVIEALTKVRGIGRWSAEMFLMFRMGRPDVLSTGDLGLRKGMMELFGLRDLPDPATMERLSAHWRPFRSVACWYLWRVAEGTAPLRRKAESVKTSTSKKEAKKAAAKATPKKPAAKKASSKLPVSKKAVSKKAPSKKPISRAEQVLSRR